MAPPLHLAVAVVGASSTAATYAAIWPFDFEDSARPDARRRGAGERAARPTTTALGSGLEAAACRVNPRLDERLLALRAAVAQARWHLTGSGGAAFALAATAARRGDPGRAGP